MEATSPETGMTRRWWGAVVALMLLESGCLTFALHGHAVAFQGTVVDSDSGAPVSGIAVEVRVGDRLVYDGATDAGGQINFNYEVKCCQRTRPLQSGDDHPDEMSVTFLVDAGAYGVVEVPVVFDHSLKHMSLGDIRVIHEERP